MSKKPLVILAGPTAVGKSNLSISLAKKINGSVISADSMQVYRDMDIGSAKITQKEMQGIPHYLIDVLSPLDPFNVTEFQKLANKAILEIYDQDRVPIIVGGTGFYIQSILYQIDFTQVNEDDSYREHLETLAKDNGNEFLHEMLRKVDPVAAEQIHMNNRKRVIRALEYFHQTQSTISSHNEEQRGKESPYQFAYFVLTDERSLLYERIDQRVDQMVKEGLVKEVQALLDLGCKSDMTSMQGLGYKEILAYLADELTLEDAIYQIKRDTRHFAKRQLTWFKREPDVIWFNRSEFEQNESKICNGMMEVLKGKEII